jgi:hypothetical protein
LANPFVFSNLNSHLQKLILNPFMQETKQINALLHLIDDPDEEVYSTVSTHIISLGKEIIPNLEHLWETTPDQQTQERIEMLIHRLHMQDLLHDFKDWAQHNPVDLLSGVLLVARYQYPDLNLSQVRMELEKIKRNVWLELNSFLTPLEQVNVLTNIMFNYYKFRGNEVNYTKPDEFLLSKLIESKKGNAISNGVLCMIIANMVDINLRVINIPRQFILACFDQELYNEEQQDYPPGHIRFYIDSANGQIYSHHDVETYFKRISAHPSVSYFKPMNNIEIIQLLLGEYAKCFNEEKNSYKQEDLKNLSNLLDEETEQ